MDAKPLVERIVGLSLKTLPRMEAKGRNLFCCEFKRDDREPRFDPDKSRRYSIMSALGAAKARAAGHDPGFDVEAVFARLVEDIALLSPGDVGLLLWLAHRLGSDRAPRILEALRARLSGLDRDRLVTMEVAWLVAGFSVHAMRTSGEARDLADSWTDYLTGSRSAPSGLIYHTGLGMRRRFPNFATQIYATLALSMRARLAGDRKAGDRAVAIVERLRTLQRPNGGWPWVYDADRGIVVEPFEVYAVHQDAMAPMALFELMEATAYDARGLIATGLGWLTQDNELGVDMIDESTGLIYRSIRRKKPMDRLALYGRTLRSRLGLSPGGEAAASGLEVNATCRPYHLGWVLEAWCGREDRLSETRGGKGSAS